MWGNGNINTQTRNCNSESNTCKNTAELQLYTYISYYVCWYLSHVLLFATLSTIAHQAPLSTEFSREWIAIPFSRGSSRPTNWTQVFCITGRFFTIWATKEAHYKTMLTILIMLYYIPYYSFILYWKLVHFDNLIPIPIPPTSASGNNKSDLFL